MENINPPLFCLLIKNTWQKLSRYYNKRLIPYGLSVPKALLLLEIAPGNGENPKSLAAKLDLENSSMTGLLDRLEKKSLIERRPDPEDRRGILIFLTSAGVTVRENIKAQVEELDRKLCEALSPIDIKAFRRIMLIINKQISE
jgi:DNA-binding MarR family transcriptional regulator